MNRLIPKAGVAVILLATLSTAWFFHKGSAPIAEQSEQQRATPLPTAKSLAHLEKGRLTWNQGDHATWNLRLRSDAGGEETQVELEGQMQACVLAAESNLVRLAMTMPLARFRYAGKANEDMAKVFQNSTVLITMHPDGDQADIKFPSHLAQEDLAMLRNAYSWLFVVRQDDSYQVEESAAEKNWRFGANYKWTTAGLEKRRYVLSLRTEDLPQVTVLESLHLGTVGHLWMSHVTVNEKFQITLGTSTLATLQMHLQLSETEKTDLCPVLKKMASLAEEAGLAMLQQEKPVPSVFAKLQESEQAKSYAGMPSAPFLESIKKLASRPYEESADAVDQLSHWLRANPQELGSFLAHIQSSQDTEETALLIHALQTSSPELANQGLSAILAKAASSGLMEQALVETGSLRSQASQELITQVWGIYERAVTSGEHSLADTAAFNLGRIARETPAVAEWLTSQFIQDLQPSASAGDQIAALRVLDNAQYHDASLLEQAHSLTSSSNADVRAAALEFTGRLPVSTVHDSVLLQALQDSERIVQVTAASVLTDPERPQSPEVQTALQEYKKRHPAIAGTDSE